MFSMSKPLIAGTLNAQLGFQENNHQRRQNQPLISSKSNRSLFEILGVSMDPMTTWGFHLAMAAMLPKIFAEKKASASFGAASPQSRANSVAPFEALLLISL
jgi:hypothetical protein